MTTNPRTKFDLLPWLLFLFSFLLRFSLISKGPYHLDCLELAISAEQTLAMHKLEFLFGPGYPLTVLLGAFFIWIGWFFGIQDPVMAVNLMSVVFSSLCIPANYVLVQKLFNKRAAFFSSVMHSILPMILAESVYGKNHTTVAFFLLTGLFYLLKYHETLNWKHLGLSGFFLAFMGATRIQDLILMTIPVSYLYFFPPITSGQPLSQRNIRNFFVFWVMIIAITVLFHAPYFLGTSRQAYLDQFSYFWQIGASSNFRGLFSPSFRISLFMITFELSPGGMLMAILGLVLLFKKNVKIFCFLFLWFIVPVTFYGNLASTASRFLIISSLPLIIAQGYFLSYLMQLNKPAIRIGGIFSFSLITLLLFSQIYPILRFRHERALLPEFARFIEAHTETQAHIIAGDEANFIKYYGHRAMFNRPRQGVRYSTEELDAFKQSIDEKLRQGIPVYITRTGLSAYNPDYQFSNLIFNNYDLIYIESHLSENWHKGAEVLKIKQDALFKVELKDADPF